MNRLSLVVLAGALAVASVAEATRSVLPSDSAGEVTLDWQKFQDLWSKMQDMEKRIQELTKPEHRPPVPFTITKAAYRGTVGDSKIAMSAIFELDIFESKEWVKIPFLPSNVAITEARIDGEPVGIVQENGFHQVVLKKPGRHMLRVAFSLRAPKTEESPQFSMNIQETPMTLLALEFARPKLDVTIEPSQGVEKTTTGSNRTLVTAALPPTSNVYVRWQKAVQEEMAGPAKIYLDNQQLVTVSEGTLKSHWALSYSILHRGVREIRLRAPEAWNILAVNCDGLQEWKMTSGKNGPELLIQLAYARRGALRVNVEAERGAGEKDGVLEIPRLVPVDVEREQGVVGIEAKGAVELDVRSASGLHAIDPKELPGELWQAATQPILFAFRFTKPYALALGVTRHPEVAVLTTTIDDANGITVVTPRGQVITKVRYQVRNQLKQYLEVRLPKEAELWSAFVAGMPVKPTQTQAGSYRIPLAKSQLGDQGQIGFPVELIYFRHAPKFLPVGYRAMNLPMPDAPVSRMMWSLYLPEAYRFPYFGGDVEKGEAATAWNVLVNNSRRTASEIFEAKDEEVDKENKKEGRFRADANRLAEKLFGSRAPASKSGGIVNQQAALAADLFTDQPVPTSAGVLPVAFSLPTAGQMFNFGQVMMVGQDPNVTFFYVHARIIQSLLLLILALLGSALYKKRAVLLEMLQTNIMRFRAWIPA